MKRLLLLILGLLAVWVLVAQPDLEAEYAYKREQLESEALLRSQSLTSAMEKHRLASVLVARSGIVEKILQEPPPSSETTDRIGYLQALAGVESVSVMRRGDLAAFPAFAPPPELVSTGEWDRAVNMAFQGSLGRAFYINQFERPFYVFFAPYFFGGGPASAVVIVTIDLGLIRDGWDISANSVSLWSEDNQQMIANTVDVPENAINVERKHNQLNATLRVAAPPPGIGSQWWLRSLVMGMLLVIGGLMFARQLDRRRFLTELAEQKASEASRLEKDVSERTRELKRAQTQLIQTEKLALLGQMSASISHEINQPLAALKNYATTAGRLLDRDDKAAVSSNLNLISGLTDRISRVVVNLRGFATQEPSPVQTVDVDAVVIEAIKELVDRFPDCANCLHVESNQADQPHVALAGRIRLLQVMANLLANAWYACKNQAEPMIVVKVEYQADSLAISVSDNGPGFEIESTESPFDAFVSSRKNNDGLGLGLSISQSFVDTMGGSLAILSSSKNGAILQITLNRLIKP